MKNDKAKSQEKEKTQISEPSIWSHFSPWAGIPNRRVHVLNSRNSTKLDVEKSKSLVLLTSNWNLVFPSAMNINMELAISAIF